MVESHTDITQDFVQRKYLVDNGPADILLHLDRLSHFLNKHDLIKHFSKPGQMEKAYFRDADPLNSDSASCVVEYPKAKVVRRASIQVMLDSLLREEHLCPIRLERSGAEYELLLAPLSEENLAVLDQFYVAFRVDIAKAYRVRRNILNLPFKSGDLPSCLAKMFVEMNLVYETGIGRVDGMNVSDESFNPDATIIGRSAEELMRLFKKEKE